MKSVTNLNEISDGKLYDIRDMVKADAGGCNGCSACCHDVGDLVELTPYDVFELMKATNKSFEDLLATHIDMRASGKIDVPYLKMIGSDKRCSFLDSDDRCGVHSNRPNICRLFPLGRVYEDDDFKYFLQVGACTKPKLNKVKVKKWVGIDNYPENKAFILSWHKLRKALSFRMKFVSSPDDINRMNKVFVDGFYKNYSYQQDDFYSQFNNRIGDAKNELGIL